MMADEVTEKKTTNQQPLILVIDDDQAIRNYIEDTLTDEGYDVLLASNGDTALQLLVFEKPDLILLDMYMPAVDGWAFLAAYPRTPRPHAPIIAMSADVDVKTSPGVVEGLPKPFTIDGLLTRVNRHLPLAGQANNNATAPV